MVWCGRSTARVHARWCRILAATGDRRAKVVVAPGLTGKDAVAFAVSRDGVRAAAIVRERDTTRLVISVIDRDAENPGDVSLGVPRIVRPAQFSLSSMTALAWASPTTLAVLGTDGRSDTQPYTIAIDGSSILAASGLLPPHPTTLAAGPNADAPIALGDRSGGSSSRRRTCAGCRTAVTRSSALRSIRASRSSTRQQMG